MVFWDENKAWKCRVCLSPGTGVAWLVEEAVGDQENPRGFFSPLGGSQVYLVCFEGSAWMQRVPEGGHRRTFFESDLFFFLESRQKKRFQLFWGIFTFHFYHFPPVGGLLDT